MTQLSILDVCEQQEELDRVTSRIGNAVLEFLRMADARDHHFRMENLTYWVRDHCKIRMAPDSAGRILRDLRKRGFVAYEVVSRRESLYRITAVKP